LGRDLKSLGGGQILLGMDGFEHRRDLAHLGGWNLIKSGATAAARQKLTQLIFQLWDATVPEPTPRRRQ
jgi:hypothetical protein